MIPLFGPIDANSEKQTERKGEKKRNTKKMGNKNKIKITVV